MASFLLQPKNRTSFNQAIKILRLSTRQNYQASLNRFEKFCKCAYEGRSTDEVVKEIKSLSDNKQYSAYFLIFQNFILWLTKNGLSNSTVQQYVQILAYYLSYHGIRVHPLDFRQNVKIPKKIKEKLHPITKEEILQIFEYTPLHRKMLYLVLIGSGMRIRECVALRKKDFELNYERIKIDIPACYTKSQTAHTTFVSKEAEKFLKPHLNSLQENELVFATNENPTNAAMTEIEAFARYRKRANLTKKYQSSNRHLISLHSFRSYFFTWVRRIHDTDIAHAMVGHTTYLGMYDRKDDNEKLELYLRVEPKLKILS